MRRPETIRGTLRCTLEWAVQAIIITKNQGQAHVEPYVLVSPLHAHAQEAIMKLDPQVLQSRFLSRVVRPIEAVGGREGKEFQRRLLEEGTGANQDE